MPRAPKAEVTRVTPVTNVFECQTCFLEVSRRSDLARHMKSHQSDRPFRCYHPGCTFSANQKGGLVTHKYTHTGEKPFGCEFCSMFYSDKSSLARHKKNLHADRYKPAQRKARAVPKSKKINFSPYPCQSTVPSSAAPYNTSPPTPYSSPEYCTSPTPQSSTASSSGTPTASYFASPAAVSPEFYPSPERSNFAAQPGYFSQEPSYSSEPAFPSNSFYASQPSYGISDTQSYSFSDISSRTPSPIEKQNEVPFFYTSTLCDTASQMRPAMGLHRMVNSELQAQDAEGDFDFLRLDTIKFELPLEPFAYNSDVSFPDWSQGQFDFEQSFAAPHALVGAPAANFFDSYMHNLIPY